MNHTDLWYYSQDGQTGGPISEGEVRARLVSRTLSSSDFVCKVGTSEWIPVCESKFALRNTEHKITSPQANPTEHAQARPEVQNRGQVGSRSMWIKALAFSAVAVLCGWQLYNGGWLASVQSLFAQTPTLTEGESQEMNSVPPSLKKVFYEHLNSRDRAEAALRELEMLPTAANSGELSLVLSNVAKKVKAERDTLQDTKLELMGADSKTTLAILKIIAKRDRARMDSLHLWVPRLVTATQGASFDKELLESVSSFWDVCAEFGEASSFKLK